MDKAAEKAAWDHDHWVLAGIRDAAAFIGGLILAIVIVIGLVVVVILAFELIIAALVYVGVPAAVAKLLVVVGGLVWLGYQVYSAYQNRISRGESGWGAFGGALADVTGITDMKRALTEKGLSPFERGFLFGRGIATVATFVFGRRLYNRIRARLPKSITNPTRGGAWRALKERFGRGSDKSSPFSRLPVRVGPREKTTGIAVIGGVEHPPIVSGKAGPAASIPKGTRGFNGQARTHVEGHTAAIMRQTGATEGTLYINNPPCGGAPGCDAMLPRMLPPGARLRVIGPDGFDKTYVGLPE